MNKVVADALTLVYKFLMPLCSKFNPALIERGLLSIAGEDAFDFSSQLMPLGSYEKVQSTLARLNERESIRKNKGVYYTPTDVVDFIVANTIKASLGVLTPENIHSLDLASEFDEDFCLKKTVFEPTCGAGEFLLATLEQKLKLWRRNHFEATKEDIECIVGTFYGNDINIDSVIISKLRLFLCVAHRYGVDYCVDLPNILNRNFTTKEIIRHRFQEDTSIRKKVLFCLNSLRHVKDTSVTNSDFNSAEVSGLYSYYKPVLQQARAILGFKFQSYSDAPVGTEERPVYTIPFVINMETLFEYYARTVLKRTFSEDCYRIEKYSRKLFLQRDVYAPESSERGIHLMPFCIPDIIVLRNETPALVIDAKYKVSGRPDRADSHQLLAYVLLTGVDRCAFILPNTETKIREMETTGDQFLTLASQNIRYYEMLLGHDYDPNTLKSVLM